MRISREKLPEGTPEDASERERRVAEIRREVESGTYLIDLDRLVERILEAEFLNLD